MKKFYFKLNYLLFLFLVLLSLPVLSQEITVKGTVKDNTGAPLPGVSVIIKGTKKGMFTDAEGRYSLKASSKDVLQFSMVGFTGTSVAINGRTLINVTLAYDVKSLNEVVVVGYGKMKHSDLTGSVGSITSEAIEKSVPTTLDQAVQGRIAGVTVVQNSGVPAGGLLFRFGELTPLIAPMSRYT